jgi:5-methylcytosine-specific restriction protein B
MPIEESIARPIRALHAKMTTEGLLHTPEQLAGYYHAFRDRFGPARLASLDGEALLNLMHLHSAEKDSLVYWLEFKNDEEFPALFGSISGGSAFKFGLYRRKEDGQWVTGSPQKPVVLTVPKAVERAKSHRDQLLQGLKLLESLPIGAGDEEYRQLQAAMNRQAPDVADSAWGHKYLSLLFPEKLDDYHVERYQRFHLIKRLQVPPPGEGRFLAAGRYMAMAREFDMPTNHLSRILNQLDGEPHRYWRLLANIGEPGFEHNWKLMRDGGYAAIGWAKLGDLSTLARDKESKAWLIERFKNQYGHPTGSWTNEIFNFVAHIQEGDIVLAFEGSTVLGIGRVTGPLTYAPEVAHIPHQRRVEWLHVEPWLLPTPEQKGRVVRELTLAANQVDIERRLLNRVPQPPPPPPTGKWPTLPLPAISGRIQGALERKKQVILYGPPGTGKTYWARQAAQELAAAERHGRPFDQLNDDQKAELTVGAEGSPIQICTFHPAYGYEDFLEGYRPESTEGRLAFKLQDGIFKRLCSLAEQQPKRSYFLIVDEINRGDIPRIFGELLTVLEKDKRGHRVSLPLSGVPFSVPNNLYLIGTMNTADRSIALLDTALRRRFAFIELMPNSVLLDSVVIGEKLPLGPWLDALNGRILKNIGRDARNLQIGHAYFLEQGRPVSDLAAFSRILRDDIVPLLEEYCYDEYASLAKILGPSLVDESAQRVRTELFEPGQYDVLISALLEPSPDLLTSQRATATIAQAEESAAGDEDPANDESDDE